MGNSCTTLPLVAKVRSGKDQVQVETTLISSISQNCNCFTGKQLLVYSDPRPSQTESWCMPTHASPPATLSGPDGAAVVKIMAFRSSACTVSEGCPPVLSHFLMLGASRLVSFDIGSYQPKYCKQSTCNSQHQQSESCRNDDLQGSGVSHLQSSSVPGSP